MSSRDLFDLEHGDTGVALLPAPPVHIAHDHDLDPSCREYPCQHGRVVGECVSEAHGATPVEVASAPPAEADKVNGQSASVYSDRDKSEKPPAEPRQTIVTDPRVKRLVGLSRWERAGMLAYIAATFPQVFDETYAALGLAEP